MVTLITQLVEDVQKEFNNHIEYSNIIVKEIYERYPKISYPAITIEEIENEDVAKYFDETERVSNLSYQFMIYCEQTSDKTATQNVRTIFNLLDSYLKEPKYRCLRRLGSISIVPMASDDNVMIGYIRYECCVDLNTNTIYRRYY